MALKRSLGTGPKARAGVRVEHVQARGVLRISGWYDGMVGIEPVEIPVLKFLAWLQILNLDRDTADCMLDALDLSDVIHAVPATLYVGAQATDR